MKVISLEGFIVFNCELVFQSSSVNAAAVPVSMQLEIAPQHHLFIIGHNGANLKHIMATTGASVHFPDPLATAAACHIAGTQGQQAQRRGTVFITGPIDSVLRARQALIVSVHCGDIEANVMIHVDVVSLGCADLRAPMLHV